MPKGGRKLCILTETNRSKVSPCQLKMPFAWNYHAHNMPNTGQLEMPFAQKISRTQHAQRWYEFALFFTKTNRNKFSTGQLEMPFAQKISCTQHAQRWYEFAPFFFTKTNRNKFSTGQLEMPFARKYHAHDTPTGDINLYVFFFFLNQQK